MSRGYRTEFAVPDDPLNLVVEAPGRIWFTAPSGDAIGLLVVTSAPQDPITRYSIEYIRLAPGSEPYDIVLSNGVVWFTERGGNRLGRIDTTSHALIEYEIPTPNSGPTGIDVSPNGMVWFTESNAVKLAQFDPTSTNFVEHEIPANLFFGKGTETRDVAIHDDNLIWFTAPAADTVLAFQVNVSRFFRVPTGENSQPNQLVMDNDGVPWVTAYAGDLVGRYAPGTLSLWSWFHVGGRSAPTGILFRQVGTSWELWIAASGTGRVSRLVVNPVSRASFSLRIPLSSADSVPWGIVLAPDDSIWIAESGRGIITQLRAPYTYESRIPVVRR